MMADRENSPAYAAPPRSARRVFAAIERAIGDGSSASVSYVDFRLDNHIARKSVSPALKLLDHLGLIEIEPGPRPVDIFGFLRCIGDAATWRRIINNRHGLRSQCRPASASRAAGPQSGAPPSWRGWVGPP